MRFLAALLIALTPTTSFAVNTQLQRSIETGLREYRIKTDVEALTNAQAAALHLSLWSDSEPTPFGSYMQKRQELLQILRWNDATNPDLK